MNNVKKFVIGDGRFQSVYSNNVDNFSKENEMNMINKLVERIEKSNKGMVIKAVGITAEGEIKVIKTSKNANEYKVMIKNGLVEVYMNGIHHKIGICANEIEKMVQAIENTCDAGDYLCQLEAFGVREDRAMALSHDLYYERSKNIA